MKSVIAVLLVLTLSTPAFAQEAACVKAYRVENADFYLKTDNLQKLQTLSEVVKWGLGPATGVACALIAKRAWYFYLGCGVLGGGISLAGYVGANVSAASVERERALAQTASSFIIYQIYRAHRAQETAESPDVAILMRGLGVNLDDNVDDTETAAKSAAIVAELMEDGTLCEGGAEPKADYWAMLESIKERL